MSPFYSQQGIFSIEPSFAASLLLQEASSWPSFPVEWKGSQRPEQPQKIRQRSIYKWQSSTLSERRRYVKLSAGLNSGKGHIDYILDVMSHFKGTISDNNSYWTQPTLIFCKAERRKLKGFDTSCHVKNQKVVKEYRALTWLWPPLFGKALFISWV